MKHKVFYLLLISLYFCYSFSDPNTGVVCAENEKTECENIGATCEKKENDPYTCNCGKHRQWDKDANTCSRTNYCLLPNLCHSKTNSHCELDSIDSDKGYKCVCDAYYEENDKGECNDIPLCKEGSKSQEECHKNSATCIEKDATYICDCGEYKIWSDKHMNCSDIPVCEKDGKGSEECGTIEDATCEVDKKSKKGYQCACPKFKEVDGKICKEIPICELGGKGVDDCKTQDKFCTVDIDNAKGYNCTLCQTYKKLVNNKCEDIPFCDKGGKGAEVCGKEKVTCEVEDNSYTCKCGNYLKWNQHYEYCMNMATCKQGGRGYEFCGAKNMDCLIDVEKDFKCECKPYTILEGQDCKEIPKCDEGGEGYEICEAKNMTCEINKEKDYTCNCPKYQRLDKTDKVCEDTPVCDEGGRGYEECGLKQMTCMDNENNDKGYQCVCSYYKELIDDKCQDIPGCNEGSRKLEDCQNKKLLCQIDDKEGPICVCPEYQTLVDKECKDIPVCKKGSKGQVECEGNNATCKEEGDSFTCVCGDHKEWNKDHCSVKDYCSLDNNKEKCLIAEHKKCQNDPEEKENGFSCVCIEKYDRQEDGTCQEKASAVATDTAAIVGGVLGALIVLILIIGGIIFFKKRGQSQHNNRGYLPNDQELPSTTNRSRLNDPSNSRYGGISNHGIISDNL